jgi:uncharacterized protein with PIN domain
MTKIAARGRSHTTGIDTHARQTRFAEFRFYEELNDFLPVARRKVSFRASFSGNPSVRDTIQALGVPHTEVDLVLVDGVSVDFNHRLRGGERVAVYPMFERLDISPVIRLRPAPLRETRFVLDAHLGRLARYLRMLGFDSAYDRDMDDSRLIDLSLGQQRIILTRDLGILKQGRVTHGHWVRNTAPRQQLREVVLALDLAGQLRPFTRCMECNGTIYDADSDAVRNQVDPQIFGRFTTFRQCGDCGKIYWRGSHYESMLRRVREFSESGT